VVGGGDLADHPGRVRRARSPTIRAVVQPMTCCRPGSCDHYITQAGGCLRARGGDEEAACNVPGAGLVQRRTWAHCPLTASVNGAGQAQDQGQARRVPPPSTGNDLGATCAATCSCGAACAPRRDRRYRHAGLGRHCDELLVVSLDFRGVHVTCVVPARHL
jgi:hypothetical protein